jgi:hypothetical protein
MKKTMNHRPFKEVSQRLTSRPDIRKGINVAVNSASGTNDENIRAKTEYTKVMVSFVLGSKP